MSNLQPPDVNMAASILQGTIGQIEFARNYTLELLDAIPRDLWYQIPDGLPTNVAWQVGHIAVSEYGLLMFRVRGRLPEDLELIPGSYRKAYTRGTTPNPDSAGQMTPDELLERMATIHSRSMAVIQNVDPADLLEPVDMPYAAWPIKLGAVMFCPMHEQIHAGQIGLLRRGLGLDPVR